MHYDDLLWYAMVCFGGWGYLLLSLEGCSGVFFCEALFEIALQLSDEDGLCRRPHRGSQWRCDGQQQILLHPSTHTPTIIIITTAVHGK